MSPKKKQLIDNRHINRRQFLIGSGSAFLVLPPLLSLMPEKIAAQVLSTSRRRSVNWYSMMGVDSHQFFPKAQADMVKQPGTNIFSKPLANISGNISRMIDADFVSMYPHMNLMQGLSLTGGNYAGHNITVLAGVHSGEREPSFGAALDVVMERSAGVYKPGEAVSSKAIRLFTSEHDMQFSYFFENGARKYSGGVQGDKNLFNTLFKNFSGTGGATQTNDDKLIVDRVFADLKTLQSNPRMSKEDKTIVDRYVASVYDLQLKINSNSSGPACTKPANFPFQAVNAGNYWWLPEMGWGITNSGTMYDNYIELIRLAFACDLTRVINVGCTIWTDQVINRDSNGGLHHEAGSSEIAADRQKWHLKKFLNLAKALQATPDPYGGGTILDNSILLWTNELGDWTTGHCTLNLPVITFGKGGGYFNTGNYIDYRQPGKNIPYVGELGRPFKQLLQSIMLSMGVTKAEYSNYGDGNGFGEFKAGINQFGKVIPDAFAPYASEHNNPLPFVTKGT